jgi:hypothetical protein
LKVVSSEHKNRMSMFFFLYIYLGAAVWRNWSCSCSFPCYLATGMSQEKSLKLIGASGSMTNDIWKKILWGWSTCRLPAYY